MREKHCLFFYDFLILRFMCNKKNMYKMFGSCVVAVAFQSIFYLEIHQNIFLFLKNYS